MKQHYAEEPYSPCYSCCRAVYSPHFSFPVGCVFHKLAFTQSEPQPTQCSDWMKVDFE